MSKGVQFKDKNNVLIYPNPYYPVGSIYLSVNNINPSKWFGGSWEQIAKGRTLVGVDENDTDFNNVKKIGGSKHLQNHRHNQILVDGVTIRLHNNGSGKGYSLPFNSDGGSNPMLTAEPDVITGNSGNLQPYFTCYIWCRIA